MLVSDLLHSCANDRVAAAAVWSIGGDFGARLQAKAEDHGMTVGAFAARHVREFALGATEGDWRELVTAVRGHDHPVLRGLEVILERSLVTRDRAPARWAAASTREYGPLTATAA